MPDTSAICVFCRRICLLFLGGLTLCAHAGELTILTEDLPPLSYEKNGEITGYATEIVQAVLDTAGLKGKIQVMPWKRALQTAMSQPDILIYPTTRLPEREQQFEWIGPLSPRTIAIFKLRSRKDIQIKTLADVAPHSVGMVREMASTKEFIEAMAAYDSHIDYAPTVESNVKKILQGRIDLIVAQEWSAAYLLKTLGHTQDELESVMVLDKTTMYWLAMNKQSDPVLVKKIRKAFDKIQQSGLMDKLKNPNMR